MFFDNSDYHINSFFEKKFKYSKSAQWVLPQPSELFGRSEPIEQFENLQHLKHELNSIKAKLNDYPIESWSGHTRRRNPAGEITWKIKNQIKAEFVTQAWCKFYECIHNFALAANPKLNSLHLCEAPGAFVAALNHYLFSSYESENIEWNWLATSLNPYYESNPLSNMVTDDRFILHTFNQWIFGDDFTGNITDRKNVENISHESQKIGDINLITADGSIDCMDTPENQEESVSFLHFAEICAALVTLCDGGSFVIKMFTAFDMCTVSMIYFLNCVFREVNVFKPATSKCGNSETYLVCLGFNKYTEHLDGCLTLMLNSLCAKSSFLYPLFAKSCIPDSFMLQHESCVRMFMSYQINVIENNIYHYENPSADDAKQCKNLRTKVSSTYMDRYKIKFIPEEKTILYKRHAKIQYKYHARAYHGSYNERTHLNLLSPSDKFKTLKEKFEEIENSFDESNCVVKKCELLDEPLIKLNFYYGKLVEKLSSSLFVDKQYMCLRDKIETILPNLCDPSLKLLISFCEFYTLKDHDDNVVLTHVLNFDGCSLCTDYGIKEKEFLTNILKVICKGNIDKIVFSDFAFLTHYSTSFLKILISNYFDETNIIFEECKIELKNRKNSIQNVEIFEKNIFEDVNHSLFCSTNIKELHQNKFSECIQNFNNKIFSKYFRNIFDNQTLLCKDLSIFI